MTKGPVIKHEDRAFVPLPREVLEDFPQLREKAVIDVVNGMEVVGDHLRWRDEHPGSILSRFWDSVTGETARRQQTLDRSVGGVLDGVKEWLTALQAAQANSDIAITRVAQRLRETRRFVKDLEAKDQDLQRDVTAISQRLDEHIKHTDKQLSQVYEKLRRESARNRAWDAVNGIGPRWKKGEFDAFPPLLRALLAANALYWDEFGAFLRLDGSDEQDVTKLCEHARNTLGVLAYELLPAGQQGPATIEDWLAPLAATCLPAERRDVAAYLLEDSLCDDQPLAASAAARLQGSDEPLPRNVPRLILPKYLGDFAMREVERRIAAEANGRKGKQP